MQTYGKIFRKVIAGFLALYILMMGIFTFSKQSDVRESYEKRVFETRDKVDNTIKNAYRANKEEDGGWSLNESLTRHI